MKIRKKNKREKNVMESSVSQQISTYVIFLSLLSLCIGKKAGAILFNYIMFAFLCCIFVVPLSIQCNQKEKWAWLVVKLLLIGSCLLKHFQSLTFHPKYVIIDSLFMIIYVQCMNLSRIYGCDVQSMHLLLSFFISLFTYILLWRMCAW